MGSKPKFLSFLVRGVPPRLSIEDQILVALEYWREYRTYFHIATDRGVSEATICRTVHRVEARLMSSGMIPSCLGKKRLVRGFGRPDVVVMDVTETPIERPKRKQKWFYSGKKKHHTLKCQIVIDRDTQEIICLRFGSGTYPRFQVVQSLWEFTFTLIPLSLEDKGYQGIARYHANCFIPKKKPKNGELSEAERDFNRTLSRERICIEHVNRRL